MENAPPTPGSGSGSAPPAPSLKGAPEVQEPGRAERAIARRSAEIRATVPDLELSVEVDAGPVLERARREQCSPLAVVLAACAEALRAVPRANAGYRDARFELYPRINIGVTLPGTEAPVVATLLDADIHTAAGLEAELVRLRARAASGELTPPEQAGVTFTVTDYGELGIHRASPLVTPPQAAALALGMIRAAAVVRHGEVVAGHVMALTLACDHRILFGAAAAELLTLIARQLEDG